MSIAQVPGTPPPATPALPQPSRLVAAQQPPPEPFPGVSKAGVPAGSTVTLDPGTGRVVQEYFDATGALTSTTPSRQQLEAYRLAALASSGTHTNT